MSDLLPTFDFAVPSGYRWLLERGLVGAQPFTALQPWHYLGGGEVFEPSQRWPKGPIPDRLVAFARRQDSDDLACFQLRGGKVTGIAVIHGWTPEGYALVASHDTFWDWLKSVVDDIAGWAESDGR